MDPISALRWWHRRHGQPVAGAARNPSSAQSSSIPDLQELSTASTLVSSDGPATAERSRPPARSVSEFAGRLRADVIHKQIAASDAIAGLMSGKNVSLHQAMISMEEASVSFQMMVEVRNKLLDSYQELMRMQI